MSAKKIVRRKKSLTSDMEKQLDSDTSQIQKATSKNVPSKWVATERMMTGRRLYLPCVYPESLDYILDFVVKGKPKKLKKEK